MAKGNRFKTAAPTIDFDDPSVLTARPADVTPAAPIVEEEIIPAAPVVEEKPKAAAPKVEVENLLAGKIAKKQAGKSYAIYLDTDVVDALDKLAKQNKLSRSKALNELLRGLLLKE